MNSKDKAFLNKFCVKESSILFVLENFGATGFSTMGGLGWYSPINEKMTKFPPIRVPSTKFFHFPIKPLPPTNVTTGIFRIYFFQGLSFLHLEITLPFAELYYALAEKLSFFCHHNLMRKGHSKLSKNETENIP